ncbi:hypothetical protein BDV95DRAFT_589236 [Massariosphaeria phaeospora]|uniref:Uncharacterized protein n=1 Tax=Massariosphaeria phaeospora TaxID=100035 RepID=A0A7C8IFE1_9PLEO|nr:hypothetical protein BDV95DRAFT_589236 [Massariosphaeria phaeospora]
MHPPTPFRNLRTARSTITTMSDFDFHDDEYTDIVFTDELDDAVITCILVFAVIAMVALVVVCCCWCCGVCSRKRKKKQGRKKKVVEVDVGPSVYPPGMQIDSVIKKWEMEGKMGKGKVD